MIFKIKWGDMERLLRKKFTPEEEAISPPTYFESEDEVIIYLENRKGNIWCSPIPKEGIEDLTAFKQEYLSNAIELLQPLREQPSLVIKQE